MKKINCLILILICFLATEALAQEKAEKTPGEKILEEGIIKDPHEKKFRAGISWNQYWGIIKGSNLPKEFFAKPCIGFNVRAEYYPLSFIGIGVGFGVQQRGTGVINEDKEGGTFTHPWFGLQGNTEDSTYRERLRFNTIEIPVTLLLRTPNDVIKGVRLSGAAGVVWFKNDYVHDFWHKPEDGFHTIIDVSDQYISDELAYQLSFGADINAGGAGVFQIHLVYTKGTTNIYKTAPSDGRLETYGFRAAWLFGF